REGLDIFENRIERIDAFAVRDTIKIAPRLLRNLERGPEHHDGFFRQVTKEMRRSTRFRQLPFQIDDANRVERFAGAECVEVEGFDRFDFIAEEIDADG